MPDRYANTSPKSPVYSGPTNRDIPMSGNFVQQFSHIDQLNGLSAYEDSLESIVPEGRLVRLFYENVHSAHPVLVPASLYEKWRYPPYLHQVLKFIRSHYSMVINTKTGASEVIAAAVLEVGRLEASPADQILAYLLWRVASASTSTKPASLARAQYNPILRTPTFNVTLGYKYRHVLLHT